MNADEMQAGKEFDRRVCEAIGWEVNKEVNGAEAVVVEGLWVGYLASSAAELDESGHLPEDWFSPSHDIAAAWRVAEKMHERGDVLSLTYRSGVDISDFNRLGWAAEWRIAKVYGWGDTASLAICRAALKAKVKPGDTV